MLIAHYETDLLMEESEFEIIEQKFKFAISYINNFIHYNLDIYDKIYLLEKLFLNIGSDLKYFQSNSEFFRSNGKTSEIVEQRLISLMRYIIERINFDKGVNIPLDFITKLREFHIDDKDLGSFSFFFQILYDNDYKNKLKMDMLGSNSLQENLRAQFLIGAFMKLHKNREIDLGDQDKYELMSKFEYYSKSSNFLHFDFELLTKLFKDEYQDLYSEERSFSLFVIKTMLDFSHSIDRSSNLPAPVQFDKYMGDLLTDKSKKGTRFFILTLKLMNFEVFSKELNLCEIRPISLAFKMQLKDLWSKPSFRPFLQNLRRFCFSEERFAPKIKSLNPFDDICDDNKYLLWKTTRDPGAELDCIKANNLYIDDFLMVLTNNNKISEEMNK